MTITITRTTEFQTTVPDECDDLAAVVDMARMEANHHSHVIDERVNVAGKIMFSRLTGDFTDFTVHPV